MVYKKIFFSINQMRCISSTITVNSIYKNTYTLKQMNYLNKKTKYRQKYKKEDETSRTKRARSMVMHNHPPRR